MMSAPEYRARAEALIDLADGCGDYGLVLELESAAGEWRRLAEMAEWQDAILAALAALGETPTSVWPDDQ